MFLKGHSYIRKFIFYTIFPSQSDLNQSINQSITPPALPSVPKNLLPTPFFLTILPNPPLPQCPGIRGMRGMSGREAVRDGGTGGLQTGLLLSGWNIPGHQPVSCGWVPLISWSLCLVSVAVVELGTGWAWNVRFYMGCSLLYIKNKISRISP